MVPVQRKLVPHGKQYQSTLIPVLASTPHGPANFMSLGRLVVDYTVHHDTSQHFHLQGSNFSGATGVNIGSGTNNTSISNSNTNAAGTVKVQPVSNYGFIMNALVNLRTGILVQKTITVLTVAEDSSDIYNVNY